MNEVSDKIFNFILENVKLLLNISDLPADNTDEQKKEEYDRIINLLTLYINMLCREIKIKTNRNVFPEDLSYLVIKLSVDAYNSYIESTNAQETQIVQSMSETDRSVSFGTPDNAKVKFQLLIQQQLNDNEKQINRYRLLYKTGCERDEQN